MGAPVIVYSGHMSEQDCAEEPALEGRIAAALDGLGSRERFGAGACGASILIGDVYCTEPFASALILDGVDDLEPVALGERALAKDFGTVLLYRLVSAD
jgi:hypothetical protein